MGSIGAGKTTLVKMLKSLLTKKGWSVKNVEININHGFSYILTLLLVKLLGYRYVSNYYWSLRFGNLKFFCKYLQLMMILDILYSPIKIITTIVSFKLYCKIFRKKGIVIIDEHYFTSIIEYLYHFAYSCQRLSWIMKTFYTVAFHLASTILKNSKVKILYLHTTVNNSIKALNSRDKTNLIDVKHIKYKSLGIKVIVNMIEHHLRWTEVIRFRIFKVPKDVIDIAKNLSKIL